MHNLPSPHTADYLMDEGVRNDQHMKIERYEMTRVRKQISLDVK